MTNSVLIDSGFLVALGIASDPRHQGAKAFLATYRGKFLVPAAVVVESCYFLSPSNKVRLLDWLRNPNCTLLDLPSSAYPDVSAILARYSALDPDFTDAAIVWLAREHGCASILTVDVRDFETYRIKGNKRFRLIDWSSPS